MILSFGITPALRNRGVLLHMYLTCFLSVILLQGYSQSTSSAEAFRAFHDQDFEKAWSLFGNLVNKTETADSTRLYYAGCIIETGREPLSKAGSTLLSLDVESYHRPLLLFYLGRIAHLEEDDRRSDSLYTLAVNLNFSEFYPWIPIVYYQKMLAAASLAQSNCSCDLAGAKGTVARAVSVTSFLNDLTPQGSYIPVPESLRSDLDRFRNYLSPAFFLPEKSTLYYSSFGDADNTNLYKSRRKSDGTWELPTRMDIVLNSPMSEFAAWLTREADTIYFSSRREGSIGGYDIFMATLDPITLLWSEPSSLGMPLNSRYDEFLAFPVSKEHWVLVSNDYQDYGLVRVRKVYMECDQDLIPKPSRTPVFTLEADSLFETIQGTDTLESDMPEILIDTQSSTSSPPDSSSWPTIINGQNTGTSQSILLGELYFSVQIGVFKTMRKPADLNNPPMLRMDTLPNGLFRYMVGRYPNYEQADSLSKDLIQKKIAASTILVAFYNGQQIPFESARKLEQSDGADLSPGLTQDEVYFTVWVGTEEPGDRLAMLRLSSEYPSLEITRNLNVMGEVYYTSGRFLDYNEARKHLSISIIEWIPNAKVVALNNGTIIPVMDAIRILKE